MTNIRENPPDTVASYEAQMKYRELYDDLSDGGRVFKYNDRHALGNLACVLVDIRTLRKSLDEEGYWPKVSGDKGNIIRKKSPLADILDKRESQALRLFKEFEMTPSSRGRASASLDTEVSTLVNDGWDKV